MGFSTGGGTDLVGWPGLADPPPTHTGLDTAGALATEPDHPRLPAVVGLWAERDRADGDGRGDGRPAAAQASSGAAGRLHAVGAVHGLAGARRLRAVRGRARGRARGRTVPVAGLRLPRGVVPRGHHRAG